MKYAFVQNGAVAEGPRSLPTSRQNISGFHHLPQDELKALGWFPWRVVEAPLPDGNYVRTKSDVLVLDDEVVETQTYRLKTEAEKQVEAQIRIEEARASRAQAYQQEADPLFFKAQRGEATMEDWLDKVQEIKNRYPK
jgi:hypothetical protein